MDGKAASLKYMKKHISQCVDTAWQVAVLQNRRRATLNLLDVYEIMIGTIHDQIAGLKTPAPKTGSTGIEETSRIEKSKQLYEEALKIMASEILMHEILP
jgi:hypothetical protein